jgi:hypothetical protein
MTPRKKMSFNLRIAAIGMAGLLPTLILYGAGLK